MYTYIYLYSQFQPNIAPTETPFAIPGPGWARDNLQRRSLPRSGSSVDKRTSPRSVVILWSFNGYLMVI